MRIDASEQLRKLAIFDTNPKPLQRGLPETEKPNDDAVTISAPLGRFRKREETGTCGTKCNERRRAYEAYQEAQEKADALAHRRRALAGADEESGYDRYLDSNPVAGRILNHYSEWLNGRTDHGRELATFEKYLDANPKVARYATQHMDFFERIFH
ncbi:MAG: hypothetical protein KDD55_13285 [Bdellovibrionales bacterium]|nr:hypothetical protein [Bdellovibrionales bacterium]